MHTNNIKIVILGLLAGAVVGAMLMLLFVNNNQQSDDAVALTQENEPLHWVAPMDPNFIRDKPGKSPMGMDLVPVYAKDTAQNDAGAVYIQPHVINNLGVKTAKVEKIMPEQFIRTVGMVRYNEDALVHVHARVEGWVEKLYVNTVGSSVEKGQPLYALYSPTLVNAQEEYLLALQRNSKAQISASKARLSALQMPDKAIQNITASKSIQTRVVFYAPQNGVIETLNIREGFFVKPSDTMMAIAGIDEVWVDAEVLAIDASKIKLNQAVTMTLPFMGGKSFVGNIDYIYPVLNKTTKTLTARIRYANTDYQLKPNMFADLVIDVSNHNDNKSNTVLAVPSHSVIRTGKQNRVVLALGDGNFKSIEVSLGQIYEQHIEILSGLFEGDEIVTSAQFLIDSESSIGSDFMRMQPSQKASEQAPEQANSSWTSATINEVMLSERKLNLSHGELESWGMPGMTMDFGVAEHIDMTPLREGLQIHIEVIKNDMGMFEVNTVHIMDEPSHRADDESAHKSDNISNIPMHNGGQ